ncbi:MAG: hypothetical protein Greene041619_740 [Candidatus Peregrinibacteria bacterium Greene0416_19]|nr:MAG: hypothetical protein Greene041619_740 [Candidatus Peregrinibacteria bacterium Greene0416_19]
MTEAAAALVAGGLDYYVREYSTNEIVVKAPIEQVRTACAAVLEGNLFGVHPPAALLIPEYDYSNKKALPNPIAKRQAS